MARTSKPEKSDVVKEAQSRFTRAQSWEATARARYVDDTKFAEGDSDNLYQWPEDIRAGRDNDRRPMLTINKARQHVLDVLNDARQAKVAVKIRATGGGSSKESADVYMGVVRHIEYISNAQSAYQHALRHCVQGGIGYWRVVTDYANDDSFDQEIFIRRVKNPLTVYLDPDINEFDGSDANWGIIFTETPREEFDKKNPKWKGRSAGALGETSWVGDNVVITAEYFRRVEVPDQLLAYSDPEKPGEMKVTRASELEPRLVKQLLGFPSTQARSVKGHKVQWFKIIGDEIADERDWPGIYIPIVRVVGEETVIEGQYDRKGHVRALKDAQRMFNYNASGSVEYGALQSKTPYLAPADAIEGFETYWDSANQENHSVLPWNHRDDEGNEIPAPIRQEPPRGAPVYMQGMMDAAEWMRMASGQYQSDMGAPSNERSGVAIQQRQRQGDNATYHYLDHQSTAIRFTGKILIDLIPKVYDTKRVFDIVNPDGTAAKVTIDPDQQQAIQSTQLPPKPGEDPTKVNVEHIFNPKVGKYEVEADVGPAYATMRQEAFEAYSAILAQNSELTKVIGDLVFRFADFPGSQEVADRLSRMIPPELKGEGPSPDLVAAQQQIAALENLVKEVATKLADKTAEHLNDQEKNAVSAYDAQTKRLGVLKEALVTDAEGLMDLVRQVIDEARQTSGAGLGPALTPDAELTAESVMPPAPPQLAGPAGLPAPGEAMVSDQPQDMGTGPAAGPEQMGNPPASM